MERGTDERPPTPDGPGWYPDPWSATGRGERYFDGKRWGSTERPRARHTSAPADDRMPSRFGGRRAPGTSTAGAGRFRRTVVPVGLLVVTVGIFWGVGQYNQRDTDSAPTESAQPSNDSTGIAADWPPPSDEAQSSPLGTPAPVPDGGGQFEFVDHQEGDPSTPVAFDPCRPVHYVIRPDFAPADGEQLVHAAVARVSTATGLQFIYDGTTAELPEKDREPYQPDRYDERRWAPVAIAWSNETEYPALAGYIAGIGGAESVHSDTSDRVYVTGQVVLDGPDLSPEVIPDRFEAEAIVLHELGHVVGLDHVADRSQLMFSESQFDVTELGDGDLRGLALLGTQACHPEV
ncbi:MAG TPA: matrixin family metalloprotease [Acidimicrobiia bacterium]|nr:matrixin family metalloprotease [Acidimicrobiia bacterium]